MEKIVSLEQIKIGSELIDSDGQIHHVLEIIPSNIEAVIVLQHYPNTKWYMAEVKCDKCSGNSVLKFTSTSAEKLVCSHTIQKGDNFYACGGKKYTEVSRKPIGIKCKGNILWNDLVKNYQFVTKE